MKTIALILLIGIGTLPVMTGCKKKTSGVCYCKYLSGDKKEYNLNGLPRDKAEDSCNRVLNGLASNFAGDCKLK